MEKSFSVLYNRTSLENCEIVEARVAEIQKSIDLNNAILHTQSPDIMIMHKCDAVQSAQNNSMVDSPKPSLTSKAFANS